MLTTGNQLRAARALISMEQSDLADRAALNVNTIRSMERAGAGTIAGRAANVQAVQRALEAAGIEFLNHGQPGVRLRLLLRQGTGDATAADLRHGATVALKGGTPGVAKSLDREAQVREQRERNPSDPE